MQYIIRQAAEFTKIEHDLFGFDWIYRCTFVGLFVNDDVHVVVDQGGKYMHPHNDVGDEQQQKISRLAEVDNSLPLLLLR